MQDREEQGSREKVQRVGDFLVDGFHYLALFVIGATIVWSAVHEYLYIMESGHAQLKDILLLFIYLELGAMVGIYFKTHRLPVQFLIYIAITALSRHLVIDVQKVSDGFHLYLLLTITGAIVLLSLAILVLTPTRRVVSADPRMTCVGSEIPARHTPLPEAAARRLSFCIAG